MKKSAISIISVAVTVLLLLCALVACNSDGGNSVHKHKTEYYPEKEATCSDSGNIEYWYCTDCKAYFSDSDCKNEINLTDAFVPALSHKGAKHCEALKPDCTTKGSIEYWYCELCDKYFSDSSFEKEISRSDTVLASLNHSKLEHKAAADSDCEKDGNIEYWHCLLCDEYFKDKSCTEAVPYSSVVVSKHSAAISVDYLAPTCSSNGNSAYVYCPTCDKYFTDLGFETEIKSADTILLSLDHSEKYEVEEKQPTCEEDGNADYWHCPLCEALFSDEACTALTSYDDVMRPRTKHQNKIRIAGTPADCDGEGNIEYWSCPDCSKLFSDIDCKNSITQEDTVLKKHPHSEHFDKVVDCSVGGNEEYWFCSDCGLYFGDADCTDVLPAKPVISAHSEREFISAVQADCEHDGNIAYWLCPDCNCCFIEEDGALTEIELASTIIRAHLHREQIPAVQADCDNEGNIEYWHCTDCDGCFADADCTQVLSLSETVVQKHPDRSHIEYIAPDCYLSGSIEYWICHDCGKYFSDAEGVTEITYADTVLEPVVHPNVIHIAEKNAGCAAIGNIEYWRCTVCDDCFSDVDCTQKISYESTRVYPHPDVEHFIRVPADCENAGKIEYWHCNKCGKSFADAGLTIEADESTLTIIPFHRFESVEAVTAGCERDGNVAYFICTVCDKCYLDKDGINEIEPTDIVIPALAHANAISNEYRPATMTDNGCREHIYCPDCRKYFIGGVQVAESEIIIPSLSTCTEGILFGLTAQSTYKVIGYEGTEKNIKLPTYHNGVALTEIADGAFAGKDITSIEFTDCIEYIGAGAFAGSSLNKIYTDGFDGRVGANAFADTPWESSQVGDIYFGATFCKYKPEDTANNAAVVRDGTKYIAELAFSSAPITSVVLPDGLELIGSNAFYGCSSLTEIIIPDSVISVGKAAFENCSAVEHLHVGEGLTEIGDLAFVGLSSLSRVTSSALGKYAARNNGLVEVDSSTLILGNANTVVSRGIRSIANYAFYRCNGITRLSLPYGLEKIGDLAFAGCANLAYCLFPETLTEIGEGAFEGCASVESLLFPSSLQVIGDSAFRDCSALSYVLLENVVSIGECAFENCVSLESFTIPDSAASIGGGVFRGCTELKNVSTGAIAEISDGAFENCVSLEKISLASSTIAIGKRAFYGCSGLSEIIMPSVEEIGDSAFENCYALTTAEASAISDVGARAFLGCRSLSGIDLSVAESIGEGAFMDCRAITAISLSDDLSFVPALAFAGCCLLSELNFGGIASIGGRAFEGCVSLAEILLPPTVAGIEDFAFASCSSVTTISLPRSLNYIGNGAFAECSGLTELAYNASVGLSSLNENSEIFVGAGNHAVGFDVTFGDDVSVVPSYLFYASDDSYVALKTATFENNSVCEAIGSFAFMNCRDLTSVGRSCIGSVGEYAFANCISLTVVDFPELREIGVGAFRRCALTSAPLNEGIEVIERFSFEGCENLSEIVIPESVTRVGYRAFANVSSASELVIGQSVKTIEAQAFYNCSSLRRVEFNAVSLDTIQSGSALWSNDGNTTFKLNVGESVTEIPAYAFYGSSVREVKFSGESVSAIGNYAFYGSDLLCVEIPGCLTNIGSYAFCEVPLREIYFDAVALVDHGASTKAFSSSDGTAVSVMIGQSVSFIPSYLFADIDICSLNFAENCACKEIGAYAFYGCNSLTSLVIPEKIKTIGVFAFANAYSLTRIDFLAENCEDISDVPGRYNNSSGGFVFAHAGNDGEGIAVYIGRNVTQVPGYIFCPSWDSPEYRAKIVSLEFDSQSVCDTIGYSAFRYCNELLTVSLSRNLRNIKSNAFEDCYRLVEISNSSDELKLSAESSAYGGIALYALNIYDPAVENENSKLVYQNGCIFYIDDVGGKTLVKAEASKKFILPQTISVKGINRYAFYNNTELTEFFMPSGVETIGAYAFYGCTGLREITLPENLGEIGTNAFNGCVNLVRVFNLSSLTLTVGSADNGFAAYYATQITLGANTQKEFTITDGYITYIDENNEKVLIGYNGNDYDLVLPDDIDYIYQYAFADNNAIITVTIPASVKKIGAYAFSFCSSLEQVIVLGNNYTEVEEGTFRGCTTLKTIEVPASVTKISDSAFCDCTGLRAVVLHDNLREIDANAFAGERSESLYLLLSSDIEWSGRIENIEYMIPIDWDDSRYEIEISATNEFIFAVERDKRLLLAYVGNDEVLTLPENIGEIGDFAFAENAYIRTVNIPDSISIIGEYAFYGCSRLEEIVLPENNPHFTAIQDGTFEDCTSLILIDIPVSVTQIGYAAFRNSGLTSFVIGENIVSVGSYAFADCDRLTSLTVAQRTDGSAPQVSFGTSFCGSYDCTVTVTFPGRISDLLTVVDLYVIGGSVRFITSDGEINVVGYGVVEINRNE